MQESCRPGRRQDSPRAGSVPVADLDVVWLWGPGAGLEKLLQALQEDTPLGAAVVHELHRVSPTFVLEQDDGVVVFLLEVPAHRRTDPLRGPVDDFPQLLAAALGEDVGVIVGAADVA
jgi:hypothetical protein